jgi:catechol 2,3-dioxygenase-like lactoylglutathione lyase family enzyme
MRPTTRRSAATVSQCRAFAQAVKVFREKITMATLHLDHVNIRTAHLAECIEFYGTVLDLTIKPPPTANDLSRGAYVYDGRGQPIIHLVATDQVIESHGPVRGAAQRGMIDHFALRCDDYASHVERLNAHGLDFNIQDVPAIGMRLIFVRDPNEVMVELGFPFG